MLHITCSMCCKKSTLLRIIKTVLIPLGDPSYPESFISNFATYPEVAAVCERTRGFGTGLGRSTVLTDGMNFTNSPAGNKPSSFVR